MAAQPGFTSYASWFNVVPVWLHGSRGEKKKTGSRRGRRDEHHGRVMARSEVGRRGLISVVRCRGPGTRPIWELIGGGLPRWHGWKVHWSLELDGWQRKLQFVGKGSVLVGKKKAM